MSPKEEDLGDSSAYEEVPNVNKPHDKKYSVKFKRNRSARACEVCHSRKVRCDATIHIPCTNCMTFGCECKFPEPKERKNAKKKKLNGADVGGNTSASSNNTNTSYRLNNGQNNRIPTPVNHKKKEPLAAISVRSAKIDNQRVFKRNSSSISFIGPASAAVLLTDNAKETNSHILIDKWIPPALKASINQTRVNLDTVQMEILRLRGAFLLPEKALCDDLIDCYFQHIYPVEPLIDRNEFMRQYNDGSVSLLLLQSVLLAASRVSTNELIFDNENSNYLVSCTFYQRAKALFDANYENNAIPVVQSLILFSRFWEGVDDVLGNSFYWIRTAISAAQGYGFHRDLKNSSLSPNDVRISRILWWELYIKDISVSVAYGRPKIIHLEDCDVSMLKIEDLPLDISRQDAEAFIQMIRLSEIMSIVLQEQYSVRAEKARQRDNLAITHCDMIMSSWRNNLSPSLQYSPQKHHSLSVNILNLYYYSAVCLVHRSNMVKVTTLNGKQYPSEGIVFRASRIIADISSKLLKSTEIRYCHALIIPVLFTASLTFICHMDSKNSAIAKSARVGHEICFEALREMGKNYLIAVLIHHSMEQLAKDHKARDSFIQRLARKSGNQSQSQTVVPTPRFASVEPNFASQQQSLVSTPFSTQSVNASSPHPVVHQPLTHSVEPPVNNLNFSATPTVPTPIREIDQTQTSNQQQSYEIAQQQQGPNIIQQELIDFPDLYLFTNTLPSSRGQNFDPSELFPTHQRESDSNTASDGNTSEIFNPNEFNLNLPEFDFPGFTNSISIQNLTSLNNYVGDDSIPSTSVDPQTSDRSQLNLQNEQVNTSNSSNIYSFVN